MTSLNSEGQCTFENANSIKLASFLKSDLQLAAEIILELVVENVENENNTGVSQNIKFSSYYSSAERFSVDEGVT